MLLVLFMTLLLVRAMRRGEHQPWRYERPPALVEVDRPPPLDLREREYRAHVGPLCELGLPARVARHGQAEAEAAPVVATAQGLVARLGLMGRGGGRSCCRRRRCCCGGGGRGVFAHSPSRQGLKRKEQKIYRSILGRKINVFMTIFHLGSISYGVVFSSSSSGAGVVVGLQSGFLQQTSSDPGHFLSVASKRAKEGKSSLS